MSHEILESDSQGLAIQEIKKIAFSRGIPIIFPTMDLEDQINAAQSTATLLSHLCNDTVSIVFWQEQS